MIFDNVGGIPVRKGTSNAILQLQIPRLSPACKRPHTRAHEKPRSEISTLECLTTQLTRDQIAADM
jgi:hypothetical protein